MKRTKKNLALLLATLLTSASLVGTLSACGGDNEGESVPSENEVTYVKLLHYDAGYGRSYLEKMKTAFQDAVKDVSYEPGKKGVYIDIEHSLISSTGDQVVSNMKNSPYDIYFPNAVSPVSLKQSGYVMDISDLLTATSADANPISPFADETSIFDRMNPEMREYYSNADGTAYGIPGFIISSHFYYDVDLVQKRGLYIAKGSTDDEIILTDVLSERQNGPDGEEDTYDDGMPETYDQFYLWMEEVEKVNIKPLHFAGKLPIHFDWALQQFWAEFEGKDNVKACWTFDGTVMDNLIKEFNADGTIKSYYEPTEITTENGYMVQRQEGRYRAMQVSRKIADTLSTADSWVHNYAFADAENHTKAQATYLSSSFIGEPIMMFAESSYWEAEAGFAFKDWEDEGGGKMDRRLAVFPTPKATRAQVGERSTVLATLGTTIFMNKAVESKPNKQAVIDFFMFYNKAENMDLQHNEASSIRPYNYVIDQDVKDNMSYLAKDYYNLMNNPKVDVVYATANNEIVRSNSDYLDKWKWVFYSKYHTSVSVPSNASLVTFRENSNPAVEPYVTAEMYFDGFYKTLTDNNYLEWNNILDRANLR